MPLRALFPGCLSSPSSSATRLVLLIALLTWAGAAPAPAQDRGVLRYLDRMSLSVTGGYHLNPWDDYNGALDTVTRRIERDPFFPNPTGQYDRINGDASVRATLGIRAFRELHVLLTGQYGQVSSDFEIFTDTTGIPEPEVFSPAHHQTMDFSFWSLGVGLGYAVPLTHALEVQPRVTVGRYSAQLDLSWRHFRNAEGPLPSDSDEGRSLSANLDDQAWGLEAGVDVSWNVFSNVSLLAGVQYRSAVFDQMRGRASGQDIIYGPDDGPRGSDKSFKVELVEASNYFGVRPIEVPEGFRTQLPPLTFLTEPRSLGDEERRKVRDPASIDLRSFGFRAGIRVNL